VGLFTRFGDSKTCKSPALPLTSQTETPPDISVIVASYNSQDTIEACLAALTSLATEKRFEVIVVDSSEDGTAALVAARFPHVTLLTKAERLYPGDARNLGVERARGEILAFTDSDCVVGPRWLDEISAAHETDLLAAGGSIDNGNPESLTSWANYFCEFTAWLPVGPQRPMIEIPTACLSVKRPAFATFGPFLGETLCSDSAFCWRLAKAGAAAVFFPSMNVAHLSVTRPSRYLARKWRHGRAFASVRAAESGFGRGRCLINVLVAPLVPFVLFARTARAVAHARSFRRPFLASAPLVLLGGIVWASGEAVSYARLAFGSSSA
jgi:GT2 family glycosyltransferase